MLPHRFEDFVLALALLITHLPNLAVAFKLGHMYPKRCTSPRKPVLALISGDSAWPNLNIDLACTG
jgi:hypothetical protein